MKNNDEIMYMLNKLREEQNLSVSEVARRVGMSKSTVSQYFNGKRGFPLNHIDKFALALNTTSEEVLGIDNNKPKGTVDEALDNLVAFNGKPVSDHDREVLKGLIESYLSSRRD